MKILHLEWARDRDGYEKEWRRRRQPPPGRTGALLLQGEPSGTYIVRKGGPLIPTTPFESRKAWRILADCEPTPDGALSFVREFGFLSQKDANEERASDIVKEIKWMQHLLALATSSAWDKISDWLQKSGQANQIFIYGGVGRLGVVLHRPVGTDRPKLRFRPASLLQGLYVQAVMDLSEGVDLRKCRKPGCPEFFPYGPGTPHRDTALYCSPKCQKAHAYSKSKGEAK